MRRAAESSRTATRSPEDPCQPATTLPIINSLDNYQRMVQKHILNSSIGVWLNLTEEWKAIIPRWAHCLLLKQPKKLQRVPQFEQKFSINWIDRLVCAEGAAAAAADWAIVSVRWNYPWRKELLLRVFLGMGPVWTSTSLGGKCDSQASLSEGRLQRSFSPPPLARVTSLL